MTLSRVKAAGGRERYRRSMRLFGSIGVGIGALFLCGAPARAAERVFEVTGVVRAPLDAGRIVVAHQEIVGFMPAMTMGFDVAGPAMLEASSLRAGDRVRFRLHVDEEHTLADRFERQSAGAPAAVETSVQPAVHRVQVGDVVPDFALVDENGRPLARADLGGKATLVTFVFTRCPIPEYCPAMARRFGELQKAIGADANLRTRAELLSITLDPDYDRPAVLKAYGEAVGANPDIWRFATGPEADVNALVKAFSVYVERNGVTLDHTLCTALIDPTGRIVDIWRGNGWKKADVLAAIAHAAQ